MTDTVHPLEKLRQIFCDIMDVAQEQFDPSVTMKDLELWDSLKHMEMVVAIEEAFGVRFSMDEIVEMTTYPTMEKIILTKLQN